MKKLLLSVAVLFATLCATAQEQVYVVMDDGSALSYQVDKVSTISFDASEASTVKGYFDIVKEIDDLKEQRDTLKKYYYLSKYDGQLVDLGLESGTLWATYNVGATKPEEYGSYFAWGMTSEYTEGTFGWYETPYASLKEQEVIDDNGNLTANYDAATANWGEEWRMPTLGEIQELQTLTSEPKEINGVQGRLFHGKNGNTLFIPFAGNYNYDSGLTAVGTYGLCWSAMALENAINANSLIALSSMVLIYDRNRHIGGAVRAVLRYK